MRITGLRTGVIGTPWRHLTFVELQTDEGLTGVGETRMINHTEALLGYLAEIEATEVIGHDPFAIEALVHRMTRLDYGRSGEIAMSALAVLEMACWDIMGKALGQPVHRLLGGPVRDRVKAYANGWYTVERSPEEFHAAARRVIERGYRALKFDPFGAGLWELEPEERRRSIGLVEAVRDAVGDDVEILVTINKSRPEQAQTYTVIDRATVYAVGIRAPSTTAFTVTGSSSDAGRLTWLALLADAPQAQALARARWTGDLDVGLLPPAPESP